MQQVSQRQQLMACLALSKVLWKKFEPWLPKLLKGEDEEAGFIVWVRAIDEHFRQWQDLPDLQTLTSLAIPQLQRLRPEQRLVVERDCRTAGQLMTSWMANNANPFSIENQGQKMMIEYVRNRLGQRMATTLQTRPDAAEHVATDLKKDLLKLAATDENIFGSHFPGGDFPKQAEDVFQKVGVTLVDVLCGGGLLSGEVVGHCAPIGQGKTTLILQLIWARAENMIVERRKRAIANGVEMDWGTLPKIYLFAYESVRTLLPNFISNAAGIPRDTAQNAFIHGKANANFSSADKQNYKDYEIRHFRPQLEAAERGECGYPNGELERFDYAVNVIDNVIRIADFSGHDAQLIDWSAKGVQGMQDYIAAHQSYTGDTGVNFVALDHVSAMVDTLVSHGTIHEAARTNAVRSMPNALGREIAAKYTTPMWAAHQLSPDENSRAPGSVPNPGSGSGSKMFLEYCAVGFASGMLSRDGIAAFKLGKQRRLLASAAEVHVARMGRMFARWESANDYTVRDGLVMAKREVSQTKFPPNSRVKGNQGFADEFT